MCREEPESDTEIEKELTEMGNAKLTEPQVLAILSARLYEKPTPSYADLSRRFQVGVETIGRICTRVAWQHIPIPEPPAVDDEQSSAGDTETPDAQEL